MIWPILPYPIRASFILVLFFVGLDFLDILDNLEIPELPAMIICNPRAAKVEKIFVLGVNLAWVSASLASLNLVFC